MSLYVKIKKTYTDFTLEAEFEAQNETMALLGASGCGKSLTLRCIAGIVRPDEGLIVSNGVTLFDSRKGINLSPQRRRVGLLFQNYALFPNMTVEGNIKAVLSKHGGRKNLHERFGRLARNFYFEGLENHYPSQLSGGQQQRVALARIMASDPSLLMLDEPLSALDSYLRWQLEDELARTLEGFPGDALYVSHNRAEARRLCDRVCVIDHGRFERARPTDELFESPETLASALLSGCKNYSRACRLTDGTVRAADWNLDLECSKTAPSGISHIGVRAHYISIVPADAETADGHGAANSFRCSVLKVTEDVFSTIVNVCPLGADPARDFSRIRAELPKGAAGAVKEGDVVLAVIRPDDIMPLRANVPIPASAKCDTI
ncbi:MAG: ATP-binding cassette domain-containing protein [Synergistaceae bacterium]|jgi:molybdate transport system ATP-binding protein|nr:ATP-binding cassette domain-containing protein [Synergistaceae bacterium]